MISTLFQFAFPVASACYLVSLTAFLFRRQKINLFFLLIGFFSHTLFQLSRSLFLGIWLPNPIFDELYFLPWALALISLGMRLFFKNKTINDSPIILICLFSLLALILPRGIIPPDPKHETLFVPLYFCIDTLAHACFILGAWFAFLFLRGNERARIFSSFIIWGFIFYSISQVVGAYWAYLGWSTPIHWSNKHLQSASIWVFFAAVLHLRYFPAWNSKQEAWFSLAGFFPVFIFSYSYQFSMMFPRIGG